MKKYTRPDLEIASFDVEDIITVSGKIVSSADLKGADADMYAVYQKNSVAPSDNVSVFTW